MTVTITLTISGSNTGPFDLYSDLDGFTTPFDSGIARATLIAGFTTANVPDWTNTIRIVSTGVCTNYIDVSVIPYTTTSSTSTTTTTLNPCNCYAIFIPFAAANDGLDDLYIERTPCGGVLSEPLSYLTYDETGEWLSGYVIRICSETDPGFRYGAGGPLFEPSTESILVFEGGNCSDDSSCNATTTTTTTLL